MGPDGSGGTVSDRLKFVKARSDPNIGTILKHKEEVKADKDMKLRLKVRAKKAKEAEIGVYKQKGLPSSTRYKWDGNKWYRWDGFARKWILHRRKKGHPTAVELTNDRLSGRLEKQQIKETQMSAFCRIRVEDVKTVSNLALSRGLEHNIMPFEGDGYADWVTIRLTNERSRRAFENLCAENDVTVDGTQVVHRMTDAVLSGASAEKVIDEALTKGMKRAMGKGAKYKCGDCDLHIPKYQGRYPKFCPECGGELTPPNERPAE